MSTDRCEGFGVRIALCPSCGEHVEWQGDWYGFWCEGPVGARHAGVEAVLTAGVFFPNNPERDPDGL